MEIEQYYDKIYRYCYFKVNNKTLAEDLTQETFLRFLGADCVYPDRYLYTIAKNLCIDEYRRVKPEPITEEIEETAASEGIPEESIMIRQALSKLSEEDREIILLRHVNGEDVGTISKALGISRFALYRRLKNAEEQLRKDLEA